MNKLSLLTLLLFGLLSCSKPEAGVNDQFLLGKWVINETILFQKNDDSARAKCINCPEITFVKNHQGFIKQPGKILTYFDWEFDEGKLTIKQNNLKPTENALNDGVYKITFGGRKLFQKITLSDTVRNTDYILKR